MKAITLYDPWAQLMAIGAKTNETRPNRTNHCGDICIHAARRPVGAISDMVRGAFFTRGESMVWHPGCIVAVVELVDVVSSGRFCLNTELPGDIRITEEEHSFGDYTSGRFIYRTRNLRRLLTPVPCRGYQCVGWTVPTDVEALVRAQL